jgi:hypothetical protein
MATTRLRSVILTAGLATAALAAAAVVAVVWATRRAPQAPGIASLALARGQAAPALAEVGVAPAEVEGLARTALGDAGFRLTGDDRSGFQARVEVLAVRLVVGPDDTPFCQVAVALELTARGDDGGQGAGEARALAEIGRGESPAAAAPSVAWRAALEGALREAAAQMVIGVAASEKPTTGLVADLDAADPRVRERAVAVLGERRAREAVPALITLLSAAEPRLADLAAGALAQIRDERAVGPLIDVSRRRNPGEQARFARLIGDIGGSQARGYLATLAAGAAEPEVRSAAEEALRELAGADEW